MNSLFNTQLNVKTVLFKTILFSVSTEFCSISSIDQVLPLWARAMAMKRDSAFPQISRITGISPSDCLVSYAGHSLWQC